jgi:hypothetical protein
VEVEDGGIWGRLMLKLESTVLFMQGLLVGRWAQPRTLQVMPSRVAVARLTGSSQVQERQSFVVMCLDFIAAEFR